MEEYYDSGFVSGEELEADKIPIEWNFERPNYIKRLLDKNSFDDVIKELESLKLKVEFEEVDNNIRVLIYEKDGFVAMGNSGYLYGFEIKDLISRGKDCKLVLKERALHDALLNDRIRNHAKLENALSPNLRKMSENIKFPKQSEVKMKCICCDKDIKPEMDDLKSQDSPVENSCWDYAVVGRIQAGYGSRHDTTHYLIAICDDCIEKKERNRNIIRTGALLD